MGSFSTDAANRVCGTTANTAINVEQGIASLVGVNLIRVEASGPGETRLRLLETLREYGRECLVSAGEAHVYSRRHAEYFAGLAQASETGLGGPDQGEWLARLQAYHPNLLAALSWSVEQDDAGLAAALAGAL